jgi:hypothetical protein
MSKTITQRTKSKLSGPRATLRNLRKRARQLLASKKPRRTRAQRRRCVARFKNKKEIIQKVVDNVLQGDTLGE